MEKIGISDFRWWDFGHGCEVDTITHAAVGAALGEWLLGKRLGTRALAGGALIGILPDLDALPLPFCDTAGVLWWHRGPSHSLLFMIAVAVAVAPWLAKRWKRDKVSKVVAGFFVFAVWGSHVLLDCFTVYGTAVWWPFPLPRVAFNQLFIIDPLFTLPLLVTLCWLAFLRTKKQQPKRRRLNAWGLGLAACYVLLPLVGIALNGTSSVLYGSVPVMVAPHRRTRAFSIFYTGTIGSGALSPILYGLLGDFIGVPMTLVFVAATVLLTLPLALALRPALLR